MPPKALCSCLIRIPFFLPVSTQRWKIYPEDRINGILSWDVLYKLGTVWVWAVKMCTDIFGHMGCRYGLLPVNVLHMCGIEWTYAVEIGCRYDMCCKDWVQAAWSLAVEMGYHLKMSCNPLYLISIAHVHILPNFKAHVKSGTHLYSTCSDSNPSLQPMPSLDPISTTRQYTNVFNLCPA